jgi:adenine-specific DNA-methyltransferase
MVNRRELSGMYRRFGGVAGVLQHLNSLPDPDESDRYVARYYSPRDDLQADYRNERMFYTRSNGLTIDRIRNEIERLYPVDVADEPCEDEPHREKALLLALLVHQSATHTNTSGVFKAYHKGFGGFSGDALSRILKPIVLPYPCLWNSDLPQLVFRKDALKLVGEEAAGVRAPHVAYLDPPYNQHQYGSNYHLLNSIVLWDRLAPGDVSGGDRAGIRKDWVRTRSPYCYRDQAPAAFSNLVDHLDARYLLVSYSTEGIIPFDELIEICAGQGEVRILTDEYVTYPGGRQSIRRLNHNIEFLIITDRRGKTSRSDRAAIDDLMVRRQLGLRVKQSYVRKRLEERFAIDVDSERIGFNLGSKHLWFQTRAFLKIEESDLNGLIDGAGLTPKEARGARRRLLEDLDHGACRDRSEELSEVLRLVLERRDDPAPFAAHIPLILRKIAHKKYRDLFTRSLREVRTLERRCPAAYALIAEKIDELEMLAHRRFSG